MRAVAWPRPIPFCFTGDADGTAADADFYEISASLGEEEEAVFVDNVSGTYTDLAVVFLMNPVEGNFLPFGETFGRIDAEDIAPASTSFGTRSS